MRALAIALVTLVAAAPLAAQTSLVLHLPVDCTIGETCFVEDYVDHDPAKGRTRDPFCGFNTRDGHKGTDIALLDFDAIDSGVAVRAAAPGKVLRTRDTMPDDRLMRGVTEQNACGNAVLLDHGNGWQTLYCHLRRGSVSVSPGDRVVAGDDLGLVGLSGKTNHPHLHMTLYHDGNVIDPFHPDTSQGCGTSDRTLWANPPAYHDTLLRHAGFSDAVPSYDTLRAGTARKDSVRATSPLVVYAEAGLARDGDVVTITATGPDGGEIFRQERTLNTPRKSQLPAFGRKAPKGGWPVGEYLGEVLLIRQGKVIAHRFAHVRVTAD